MKAYRSTTDLRRYLPEAGLFESYRGILGDGDDKPQFMVVKKQPSIWDMNANRSFMGDDGIAIRRGLVQAGYRFYMTTAFPFAHPSDKIPLKTARLAETVFAEEIRRVGTKKHLLMGVEAAKLHPYFTYDFHKLNDLLHRNIECGDHLFRVVQHPGIVANNPALYRDFLTAVEELVNPAGIQRVKPPRQEGYLVITDREQARRILVRMGRRAALDVETTGLDPYTARMLTLQVSWQEGYGYSFDWDLFTPDEWASLLSGHDFIFQNGTYDVKVLAMHGVSLRIAEDTMLMHSIIDETPGGHSMDVMAQRYLGVEKWGDTINYDDMEGNDKGVLGRYGARDTDLTLRLANHFLPQTKSRPIHEVLHRAQNAVTYSELRGVRIDREKANQFSEEIERALHDRQEYIADTYGLENCNSPAQVKRVLYDDIGLPPQKDKGKVSTSQKALEPLKGAHPILDDIFEYRHLTKAQGMYLRNILEGSERDGRYHGQFRLAATETGRLAEKLLMLIPRADELANPDLGKQYQVRMRELFMADEGHLMIGADYSGLEVTMAAYLTKDAQLIRDIQDRLDTHSVVAIQAFGLDVPMEPLDTLKKRVSSQFAYQRELAKRGTFSWLYGGGESAIASGVGTDLKTARLIMTALRERYQGVAAWQDAIKATVQHDGHVSTPWGRTRHFNFNQGLAKSVLEGQLREAINCPNQGMATDMNLAAFAILHENGYDTLFPMHDANYLQAPEDDVEEVAERTKTIMEGILPGIIPFRADVKWGKNWATLG